MQQIPLVQINWRRPAITVAGGTGYVADLKLARAQREAHTDEARRMAICRWLVQEKIARTLETLTAAVPESSARDIALRETKASLQEMRECPPQSTDALHGIEGRVAQMHFRSWRPIPLKWEGRKLIPEEWWRIGPRVSPKSGTNRDATHPVNAMLSYGYAVLETQVRISVIAARLDPRVG
jgi:CRISPR-associated protein Cas1